MQSYIGKNKKKNKNHTQKNQTPQHKNMAGGESSRSQNGNINWTYHRTKFQENQQSYKRVMKLKHRNAEETQKRMTLISAFELVAGRSLVQGRSWCFQSKIRLLLHLLHFHLFGNWILPIM